MRNFVVAFLLVTLLPVFSNAQSYPKPTPADKQRAEEVIQACVKVGALNWEQQSGSKKKWLNVKNLAKLREAVASQADLLTPPVIDALIVRTREAEKLDRLTLVVLLHAVADQTKNRRPL